MSVILMHGDANDGLKDIPDNTIEAMITDPPAGIGIIKKDWDMDKGGRDKWIAWMTEIMAGCHRVLKPGAHGLVWSLPRTAHWTMLALENAGFEIRDTIVHLYANATFIKGRDVSKDIDVLCGGVREKHKIMVPKTFKPQFSGFGDDRPWIQEAKTNGYYERISSEAATDKGKEWNGWGSMLRQGHEDWILIRKKPIGSLATNILESGVGALNLQSMGQPSEDGFKFPHNVVVDGSLEVQRNLAGCADYYYVAKPNAMEKNMGVDGENLHPTVKPVNLLSAFCNLITPKDGTVLDPFMGSGSVGVAAVRTGHGYIGIELEEESYRIARQRVDFQEQLMKDYQTNLFGE